MSGVEQAVEIIEHSMNQDSSIKASKSSKYHEKQDQGDKENEKEFEEKEQDDDSDRQPSRHSSIYSFDKKVFNLFTKHQQQQQKKEKKRKEVICSISFIILCLSRIV